MEAFLHVADLQSFTKAAKHLFMSQPAVSFQIKSLEEELQIVLFQRGEKQITLTPAGKLLYPEAKQMLIHYQNVKYNIDQLKGLKRGQLTLAASTIPGEYLIPLCIGGFCQINPGIQVKLKISDSGQVVRWLLEREVDLGVIGAEVDEEELDCVPWIEDRLVIVAPNNHSLANQQVSIQDLGAELFVMRESSSGTRQTFMQKMAHANMAQSIHIGMELGSTMAVITAVQAGLGIGVVSSLAAKEPLQTGRVKEIKITDLAFNRMLYVVRYKNWIGNYAADNFFNFLKEHHQVRHFAQQSDNILS